MELGGRGFQVVRCDSAIHPIDLLTQVVQDSVSCLGLRAGRILFRGRLLVPRRAGTDLAPQLFHCYPEFVPLFDPQQRKSMVAQEPVCRARIRIFECSSSWSDVKGWCAGFHRFSDSSLGESFPLMHLIGRRLNSTRPCTEF